MAKSIVNRLSELRFRRGVDTIASIETQIDIAAHNSCGNTSTVFVKTCPSPKCQINQVV